MRLSTCYGKCPCHHKPVWMKSLLQIFSFKWRKWENRPQFKTLLVTSGVRRTTPLIPLSGLETAAALSQNLSQTGEGDASSIKTTSHTDFSFYRGGPLQRPGPLSFHIFVPTPVIRLGSAEKRSSWLALLLASHLSWSLPLCSITFLTSNEEWTFFFLFGGVGVGWIMMRSPGQSCKWNAHFGAESIHWKRGGCEGSQKKKNHALIPHYRTSNTKARMSVETHLGRCHPLVPSLKSTVCTLCCSAAPDHCLTMLTVRFGLGTDLMPRSLFPPSSFSGHLKVVLVLLPVIPQTFSLIGIWWLKAILCFILALPEIVARPQIWHDNIRSPRRRTAASEQPVRRVSAATLS